MVYRYRVVYLYVGVVARAAWLSTRLLTHVQWSLPHTRKTAMAGVCVIACVECVLGASGPSDHTIVWATLRLQGSRKVARINWYISFLTICCNTFPRLTHLPCIDHAWLVLMQDALAELALDCSWIIFLSVIFRSLSMPSIRCRWMRGLHCCSSHSHWALLCIYISWRIIRLDFGMDSGIKL